MKDINTELEPKMDEYRACQECDFETFNNLIHCPNCSAKLHTESEIRKGGPLAVLLGWIFTIIGTFVMVGLTALFILGRYYGNVQTRKNLSEFEGIAAFLVGCIVAASILGFGVAMIFAGRFATRHGRLDRRKIKLAIILISAGLAIGGFIAALFG